jgi:haloalkane dehalogenase
MDHYRKPFVNAGEDRRLTLSWPRQIPIEGEPPDVVKIVSEYGQWLAHSQVPKLYFHPNRALSTMAVSASFAAPGPTRRTHGQGYPLRPGRQRG